METVTAAEELRALIVTTCWQGLGVFGLICVMSAGLLAWRESRED